jgi:hypothetical protein
VLPGATGNAASNSSTHVIGRLKEEDDMPITRKVASIAFAGAAATGALGMAAGPALAVSGVWHIKAAGAGYKGAVKGKNKGTTKLVDTTHAVTLTCTAANVSGSVPHSTVTATGSSTKIGQLKAANFSHCSFLGVTFKAKLNATANIWAKSYNATTKVAHGHIKAINAELSGVGNSCKATVTGPLFDNYKNASHEFVVDPTASATLTIHSPTAGCPIIKNGDKAYFQGTFPTSTPKSLTVSDP